jgi:AAA domain
VTIIRFPARYLGDPHLQKPFSTITVSTASNYLVKGILPRVGLAVVYRPPKCVPFYLLDVPVDLVADHNALIDDIRDQVVGTPAIVVVDTLNRAMFGNENDCEDMAKFIRAADAVRAAFNCLVIVIHHCGVVGNRPRGRTSLAGADDAQIAVERDKEGNIVAKVEFMKDAEGGAVTASKLEQVDLGTDSDGDKLTSCIAVPAEGAAAGLKLSKVQRFAFELMQKLIINEGLEPPAEANLPAGTRIVLNETWRKQFYDTYPAGRVMFVTRKPTRG